MIKEILTVKDLAERWNCTEYSIRKQVSEGSLKARNLPGAGMRFRLDYIEELEGTKEIADMKNYRKVKKELEEYKKKYEDLKGIVGNILSESSKIINL